MASRFSLDPPQGDIVAAKYNSYKPLECKKSVKVDRSDIILLSKAGAECVDIHRWASLKMLLQVTATDNAVIDVAEIELLEPVNDRLVDTEVYAPHLVHSGQTMFIPAENILQRVMVCSDRRCESHGAFWINWFVTWGMLPYPIAHRDQVHRKYGPSIEKPV